MKRYVVIEFGLLRKLFFTGSLVAVFLAFYDSRMADMYQSKSLESLLMLAYGDLSIQGIKFVVPVLFWVAPQVFLLYFLGEYLSDNLDRNAVYIFTRTDRRKTWLLGKVMSLFLYVFFYWVIQFVTLSIVGRIMGYHMANWGQGITMIVSEVALQVLLNYMIILIINLLSIRINLLYSVVIVLAANFFCFFCSEFLAGLNGGQQQGAVKWFPFTQGILSWHSDAPALGTVHGLFGFHVQGYSTLFSVVYLVIICVVAVFIGIRNIEKMDLL